MSEHETKTTIANTDLWASYFKTEWSRWSRPSEQHAPTPVNQIAEGTAARVANFLTLVASGPLAWLYTSNYAPVAQIRSEEPEPEAAPLHPCEQSESVEDFAA